MVKSYEWNPSGMLTVPRDEGDYVHWRDHATLQEVNAKLVEALESVTDGLRTYLDIEGKGPDGVGWHDETCKADAALAAAKELEGSK